VNTVKALVRLMRRHDLTEINLRDGDQRICLRRGSVPLITTGVGPVPVTPAVPVAAPAPTAAPKTPAAEPGAAKKLVEIKCPAVGTFYAKPKPDAPPYVTVGSRVTPTTIVCQIEAMKQYNEIPADCSGVIVEVVAENQQFVEFNQVLFRVDPTG
jgi:acetyl-CoA carboxylase biotin carboxyl carrier protein